MVWRQLAAGAAAVLMAGLLGGAVTLAVRAWQTDAEIDALRDALAREVPHPNAVRLALERRRQERDSPPPIGVSLPDHVKRRDVTVRPHSLAGYDQLTEAGHDDE